MSLNDDTETYSEKDLETIAKTIHEGILPLLDLTKIANSYILENNFSKKVTFFEILNESLKKASPEVPMIENIFLGEIDSQNMESKIRGYVGLYNMGLETRLELLTKNLREIKEDLQSPTSPSNLVMIYYNLDSPYPRNH